MITKEELLQKGMTPEDADEILAKAGTPENSSPLEALKKAIEREDDMETLFKAKKGEGEEEEDDDDEDEEYDEKFMKKMKKYMKSKGKEEHEEPDGDEGMFGKMKKAVDEIDPNAEGGVIEMADLTPVLDAMVETVQTLSKAVANLNRKMDVISEKNDSTLSLMAKAAAVQVETAEIITEMGNKPMGRKGALMTDMSKAKPVVDGKAVWTTLVKALNNGDMVAGAIGSKFESAGKNFNALNKDEQKYVNELMTKEAN